MEETDKIIPDYWSFEFGTYQMKGYLSIVPERNYNIK